jgi:uncharacterized protein YhfF
MRSQPEIAEFWKDFRRKHPAIDVSSEYQVWYFGNSPEMAAELSALVLAGKKTATASLAATNELKPHEAPVMGGLSVVTSFDGKPICVLRTTEIEHLRFLDVPANFATLEGEGDLSLEYWRRVHREYYTKEAAELGIEFNEDSLVCCERFELLFPK